MVLADLGRNIKRAFQSLKKPIISNDDHLDSCPHRQQTSTSSHSYKRATSKHHHHHHHNNRQNLSQTVNIHHSSYPHNHQSHSHGKQIPLSKSKLPPGFSKLQTVQGQVYFEDSQGRKYWYDPSVPRELLNTSLDLDELVGQLSETWEIKQAPSGKVYYVNHIRKTTQFTDPRLVAYRDYLMSIIKPKTPSTGPATRSSSHHNHNRHHGTKKENENQRHRQHHSSHARHVHDNNHNNSISQSQIITTTADNHDITLLINSFITPSSISINDYGSHDRRTSVDASRTNTNISISENRIVVNHNNDNNVSSQQEQNDLHHHHHHHHQPQQQEQLHEQQQSLEIPPSNVTLDKKQILCDKISLLRQELLKQQLITHPYKIEIRRKKIFEESFRIVSQMKPKNLKKRLFVKFRGEEGLDFGGIAREWFHLLSREMLNPMHGLFEYTGGDSYNLQISPDSGIVYKEHLDYMHFCGRIIGLAVFHGHHIEGHFTVPFYKMLLRRAITLDDIKFVDPELHRSLCWMLDNDITDVFNDTTFLIQHNAFGQLQEHELKDNGRDMLVTEKNKHEYVSLYVNYRCRRGIERQFEALQRAFDELINPHLLKHFDEHELELLIGGLSIINIDDWQVNTKLKNCNPETALVKWFWELVRTEYDEAKRASLLQFVTGSTRVPIQGFKALRGINSEARPFTIHMIKNGNTNDLPKSHTCFNRLDLPQYETYDRLRDKLTQAIEETMGFAIQ